MQDVKKSSLKKIKVIFFDVDGVFTNGQLHYFSNGDEAKSFNSLDGLGLILLKQLGIRPVIITARDSKIVEKRFKELEIEDVYQGVLNKRNFVLSYLKNNNFLKIEAAFAGDDLPDLYAFSAVGTSFAPSNASSLVKSKASIITIAEGGHGAVREICDLLMQVRSASPKKLFKKFLNEKEVKNAKT